MATYDVVQKVDGNITTVSTWEDDKSGAKKAFHDRCALLYAETSVTSGVVAILDDNLDVVDGKREFIKK